MLAGSGKGRYSYILLTLIGAIFLFLLHLLYANNRFATDDFFSIYNLQHLQTIGTIKYTYNTWSVRPVSLYLSLIVLQCFNEPHALYFTGLLFVSMLWLSLFRLIAKLLPYSKYQLHPLHYALFALIAVVYVFFGTLSVRETWFWYCSSYDYLLPIIAFIFLCGNLPALADEKKKKAEGVPSLFMVFLQTALIWGGAESFALFAGAFITFHFLYNSLIQKRVVLHSVYLFNWLGMIAFLIFYYTSPGMQHRKDFLHQAGCFETLYISLRALGYLIIKWLPNRLLLLINIGLLFWFLPVYDKPEINTREIPAGNFFIRFAKLPKYICTLLGLTFISLIPTSYIMSDRGPDRSLAIASLLLALSVLLIVLQMAAEISPKQRMLIARVAALLFLAFLFKEVWQQAAQAPNYAMSVDRRLNEVMHLKDSVLSASKVKSFNALVNQGKQPSIRIPLAPLQPEKYLYPATLDADTAHFSNRFFKMRYNLPFSVYECPR